MNLSSASGNHESVPMQLSHENGIEEGPPRKKRRACQVKKPDPTVVQKKELSFTEKAGIRSLYGLDRMPKPIKVTPIEARHSSTVVFSSRWIFSIITDFLIPRLDADLLKTLAQEWSRTRGHPPRSLKGNFERERILSSEATRIQCFDKVCTWLNLRVSIPPFRGLQQLAATCRMCYNQFHSVTKFPEVGATVLQAKAKVILTDPSKGALHSISLAFINAVEKGKPDIFQLLIENAPEPLLKHLFNSYQNTSFHPYFSALEHYGSCNVTQKTQFLKICEVAFVYFKRTEFPIPHYFNGADLKHRDVILLFINQMTDKKNPEAQKIFHEFLLTKSSFFLPFCFPEAIELIKAQAPQVFKGLIAKGAALLNDSDRFVQSRLHKRSKPDPELRFQIDQGLKILWQHGWKIEGSQDSLRTLCDLGAIDTLTEMLKSNPGILNFGNSLHYAFLFESQRKKLLKDIFTVLADNQFQFYNEQPTLHHFFNALEIAELNLLCPINTKSLVKDSQELLEQLLKAGISTSTRNGHGEGILFWIFYLHIPNSAKEKFATLLIAHGASVNIKDRNGIPWIVGALVNGLHKFVASLYINQQSIEQNLYTWTIGCFSIKEHDFQQQALLESLSKEGAIFGYKPFLHEAVDGLLTLLHTCETPYSEEEHNRYITFIQGLVNAGLNPKTKCIRAGDEGRFVEDNIAGYSVEQLIGSREEIREGSPEFAYNRLKNALLATICGSDPLIDLMVV